jgi:hypothetical protein
MKKNLFPNRFFSCRALKPVETDQPPPTSTNALLASLRLRFYSLLTRSYVRSLLRSLDDEHDAPPFFSTSVPGELQSRFRFRGHGLLDRYHLIGFRQKAEPGSERLRHLVLATSAIRLSSILRVGSKRMSPSLKSVSGFCWQTGEFECKMVFKHSDYDLLRNPISCLLTTRFRRRSGTSRFRPMRLLP